MKRVNIPLSTQLHTKAKLLCVLKGITLNEYLAQAIASSIEQDNVELKRLAKNTLASTTKKEQVNYSK